jgi:orotidine-5'-phosphate decarboxylase
MTNPRAPRVIVALDFSNPLRALSLADRLDPHECGVKVGKELFVVAGPEPVRWLAARGFNVFLDLKFHDIPNTVAQACASATRLGVWMMNVHAAGGRAMLKAARDAVAATAAELGRPQPLLIAVTVLTSLDQAALRDTGIDADAGRHVLRLATLTHECGLDGVVCSAVEAPSLRSAFGPDFALVTPGIRPAGSARDDQARIVTPEEAVEQGANYLVIGRPITAAADPIAALAAINRAIGNVT